MNSILGSRIAELRKKKNVTQAQLAVKLSKSTSTIAMWETGMRDPDSQMILELSKFFGVSTDYLFGTTNNPIKTENENEKANKLFDVIARANDLPEEDIESVVDTLEALINHHQAKQKNKKDKN